MKIVKKIFYTFGIIILLLIGIGAVSKAFKSDVLLNKMECIAQEEPYKQQKINLLVYEDKLNDGTYDYNYFTSDKFGSSQMLLKYYRNFPSGNILLISEKKILNNKNVYFLQFAKEKEHININFICSEKNIINKSKQ